MRRHSFVPLWSRLACALAMLSLLAGCAAKPTVQPVPETAKAPPAPDGRTVITAMYDRYIGKWYMTLTFKQNVRIIGQRGRETRQVWNHYLTLPGRQRIDYLPLSTKSGVLYADGMLYSYANGKQDNSRTGWHPLLVLTGDVYTQLPDTTAMQLDSLGFDLSIARRDSLEGKDMWVVGAQAGDSTSSQFWVDADSLLVRRVLVGEVRAGRTTVNETRYLNYKNVAGYPVAFSMRSYRDGRLYFRGESTNVKEGERLPVELFESQNWASSQLRR